MTYVILQLNKLWNAYIYSENNCKMRHLQLN